MNEGTYVNEGPAGLNPDPSATYTGATTDHPGKRVVLAGLGAVATARDVANETFERFVDRGNVAQDDVLRRVDDVRLNSAGRRSRFSDAFRSAMNMFLDSVNVPNKADVEIINTKLNIVTRKLDDLQMQAVPGIPPAPPVTPVDVVVPPVDPLNPVSD